MLAERVSLDSFIRPRAGVAVDLEAHLHALPPKAAGKGMYFRDLFDLAEGKASAEEIAAKAGIPHRRYIAFFDYPMSELLKVTVEVAKIVYPKMPLGDALRLLGRRSYVTLLNSHAGRVLLMSLGQDIERVLMVGPKAFKLVLNFGSFAVEKLEERHIRFSCDGFPALIETYQVGVIEGVFEYFKVTGEVKIAMKNLGSATFDIVWDAKD